MSRLNWIVGFCAATLISCNYESPTAPITQRNLAVAADESIHGISMVPHRIALTVGGTATATVHAESSRAVPITFTSIDPAIAIVRGSIAPYTTEGALEIFAMAPGVTEVAYTIPNIGRAGGGGTVGTITVTELPSQGPCVPPVITQEPRSMTARRGESVVLSFSVTGSSPAVQWFQETDRYSAVIVPGAVARTLQTPPVEETTRFFAEVWNACGTAYTERATVSVQQKRRSSGS